MEKEPNRSSWSIANLDSPWHTVVLVCFVAILSYCAARLGGMLTIGPQADWPLWLGNVFLTSMLLLVPRGCGQSLSRRRLQHLFCTTFRQACRFVDVLCSFCLIRSRSLPPHCVFAMPLEVYPG